MMSGRGGEEKERLKVSRNNASQMRDTVLRRRMKCEWVVGTNNEGVQRGSGVMPLCEIRGKLQSCQWTVDSVQYSHSEHIMACSRHQIVVRTNDQHDTSQHNTHFAITTRRTFLVHPHLKVAIVVHHSISSLGYVFLLLLAYHIPSCSHCRISSCTVQFTVHTAFQSTQFAVTMSGLIHDVRRSLSPLT